jgi:hypothetical protein
MPYLPRGVAQPQELLKNLNTLQPFLPPAVVKWRYTLDDWSGDPSIFFWITLSDEAAKPQNLPQITKYVTGVIAERINPRGQWGLIPYLNFRSQSEQRRSRMKFLGKQWLTMLRC